MSGAEVRSLDVRPVRHSRSSRRQIGRTLVLAGSDFLIWSSTMAAPRKSRNADGVKRRGASSNKGAAPGAPDATLVALGSKLEALSAELSVLQNDKATPFFPTAARGEELIGGTALNPSAQRIEEILALLDPIERAIMATPAQTVVGLGVKARHAAHVLSHYWMDSTDALDWDVRAVRLLIESTCSVAGVGLVSSRQ
jgi:hypothetical protein